MKPALSLLEGKWFPKKHVSVRDLFGPLFTVWTPSAEASYHYEQFTNKEAFIAAIRYAFQSRRASTIYVGAHGDKNAIHGFHDEGIQRTVIRNALKGVTGTTKRGIYFGACSFVHRSTAEFVLPKCPRVSWIAGYHETVDWVDSSALDLCFFRHFLFPTPGKGTPLPNTAQRRLEYAVRRIRADMEPLTKRLGFHVFLRREGGRIVDLLA